MSDTGCGTVSPAQETVSSAAPPAQICDLCGLPLGRSKRPVAEGHHRFCCPGCRQVFLILRGAAGELPVDFAKTALFRTCVEAGVIPGKDLPYRPVASTPLHPPLSDGGGKTDEYADDPPPLSLRIGVGGMWCPACSWIIEELLERTQGIQDAQVSFFSDTLCLRYLPHIISPREILANVEKLGFTASTIDGNCGIERAEKDLLKRLGITAILSCNAMMLSWALYYGFFGEVSAVHRAYFSIPLFLFSVPAIFYGGAPIFKRAWLGLRANAHSMDALVTISVLAAFIYSLVQFAQGSIHLYLDTAAMLVTIVLAGRYVETRARQQVLASLGDLDGMAGQKVRLVQRTEDRRTERWVAANAVIGGDRFIVRSEERVPLDGHVARGEGLLDVSVLTGEPKPVTKTAGEPILAGSLLLDGDLEIVASGTASDSAVRQMAELIRQGVQQKAGGEQLADRLSRLLVPAVVSIAGITGFAMAVIGLPLDETVLRMLTVMLIACPCVLGVAVPLVKVAIIGLSRSKGILVRNPEALEKLRQVDTVVLDKTGTVTEGRFVLREVICRDDDEREALRRVGAIEAASDHFLGREIVRYGESKGIIPVGATEVEYHPGLGVTGRADGEVVFAGNRRLASIFALDPDGCFDEEASAREKEGTTVVFFGWGEKIMGFMVFGDKLRSGSKDLVSRLLGRGKEVWLLSGDGDDTTAAVAKALGIDNSSGKRLPPEKAAFVRDLQSSGHKVAMVGDGINDAAAMALADVAISLGTTHDIMREASDMVIASGAPTKIMDLFALSSMSARAIRQNLSFAFAYNALAIPVAAAGLLSPLLAVLAMLMSSVTVIANSLRIVNGNHDRIEEPVKRRTGT